MDSEGGEGRPHLGPALSVQTDDENFLQYPASRWGGGVVSYPCKTREMNRAMEQGVRTVRYDPDLGLEAYHFSRVIQIFPSHFHEYYTLGFLERGLQHTICRGTDCLSEAGDLLLFAPGDVHSCRPVDGRSLDYGGLNVPEETMARYVREITGEASLPRFREPLVRRSELTAPLRSLHRMVMEREGAFCKEETFLLLLSQVLDRCTAGGPTAAERWEARLTADLCAWLDDHCTGHVSLEELSRMAGRSKYSLIRAFTRERGITPYSYLMAARVGEAKRLLEAGTAPAEAALEAGFSDQSHLTNQFKRLIGLTPGQYAAIFRERGGGRE